MAEKMQIVTKEYIIRAMARMSNWLVPNNLVQGGCRVPVEGSGGAGLVGSVLVGNIGLWNATGG